MSNLFFIFLIFSIYKKSLIITTFAFKDHRIDEESIKTQFDPQFEIVPFGELNENIPRKVREIISNNKEGGGVGIYWMSPEGQDFQTWSLPKTSSSYGSGMQQTNIGIQKNVNKQQLDGPLLGETQQISSGPSISFHQQPQFQNQQQPQAFQQGSYSGYGQYIGQQSSAGGISDSSYLNYLQKQINTYPVMIYTLSDCIPCQRAKHLLAVNYPDVRAHYLELSGNEPWQQQLQIQLQYLTGAITFPYIFVCGQYIGGGSELFDLHESGQLRRLISQCLQKQTKK